ATGSAKFDLSLGLIERRTAGGQPAGIEGVLEYASDLFDEESVVRLGQRLIRLLTMAAADGNRALGAFDILGSAERDTILRAWNDTAHSLTHSVAHLPAPSIVLADDARPAQPGAAARPASLPATLPELFAAQALRTPDAVAVIFEDRTLTYAALDAQANRLAHHLQSLGVKPETVVGLLVERSPEMVVGLLGILKAGGAYLALDPNYPRERVSFMLVGAGAAVLVTQAALSDSVPEASSHRHLVRLDADWPAIAR